MCGLCEQTIEGVKEKLSVLDLVVLLVFHQTKHRKAVESLVRNKIRSGAITETLLHVMFTNHSQVCFSLCFFTFYLQNWYKKSDGLALRHTFVLDSTVVWQKAESGKPGNGIFTG